MEKITDEIIVKRVSEFLGTTMTIEDNENFMIVDKYQKLKFRLMKVSTKKSFVKFLEKLVKESKYKKCKYNYKRIIFYL